MRYVVLDAETTIRNTGDGSVGDMAANPFFENNRIVALGELWTKKGEEVVELQYNASLGIGETGGCKALEYAGGGKHVLIVGHNIAFDLLYLMKAFPTLWEMAQPYVHIWDTAEAEYLLSGQRAFYPSLDECCIARGLPVKDDRIKEYWNQGIDTPLIPKDELLDYLRADLTNTHAVFRDQWSKIKQDFELLNLMRVKMDDILMTTHMTWYGMKFDLELAAKTLEELDPEIATLTEEIRSEGQKHFVPHFEFNPESPTQMSVFLYGGSYTIAEDVPQKDESGAEIRFKGGQRAGQVKTKKTKVRYETKGLSLPTKGIPSSRDGFSTAEEYLVKLKHPVVEKLLRLRELVKDAETYYRGYSSLVWPDGMIHPQRNHTSTVTGRLSCSAPNLENVSKPDD